MTDAGPHHRSHDPGLQPERTGLAWSRTALSMVVVGLLCFRAGWVGETPLPMISGCLAIGLSPVLMLRSWQRPRYRSGEEVTSPTSVHVLRLTTLILLVVDVLEFAQMTGKTLALNLL